MRITAEDLRHRLLPILLAQGFGFLCGVAGVAVTSHWVRPAEYGAYGVFVSFASVGAIVVYAGLIKFMTRYWLTAPDRGAMLRGITRAFVRKTGWLIMVVIAITLLTAPQKPWFYGTALFASALFFAIAQLAQTALQAAREHWKDLGVSTVSSVSRSFLPPIFYLATHAGQWALLAGFAAQTAIAATVGALTLRRWKPTNTTGPGNALIAPIYEGPWFVALALVTWALAGLHRWLANWFFGAEVAGYFTLAGNIGTVLPTILSSMLLLFVQPHWFSMDLSNEAARRKLMAEVDRFAAFYTCGAAGLTIGLHAVMPWLVGRLIGAQYAQAADFVLMTGCAATSLSVALFYHVMLLAAKQETRSPRVDLSGAACLVGGSIISAAAGLSWFKIWLLASPLVPWLVNRTLARSLIKGASLSPA